MVTLYEIKTFCGTKEELPFPEPGDVIDDNVQRRLDTGPLTRGEIQDVHIPYLLWKQKLSTLKNDSKYLNQWYEILF